MAESAKREVEESPDGGSPSGAKDSANYRHAFQRRFGSYLLAQQLYPDVMVHEEAAAVEALRLGEEGSEGEAGLIVQLEAGGSIPRALGTRKEFVAFESHPQVLEILGTSPSRLQHSNSHPSLNTAIRRASPAAIPLPDASAARILFLAVLHHYDDAARREIYRECLRVLRPNGALVIGDVVRGSAQDRWLNSFVDAYNPFGHAGTFFEPAEARPNADADLLRACGFDEVEVEERRYDWVFASRDQRTDFLRKLFYLTAASDDVIERGVQDIFGELRGFNIPWRLVYYTANKV